MADAGMDLWSPAAVTLLKQQLRKQLRDILVEAMDKQLAVLEVKAEEGTKSEEEEKESQVNGSEVESSNDQAVLTAEQRKDILTQWLYDISYLQSCFGAIKTGDKDYLADASDTIYQRSELGSEEARERMVKSSQEYWKRTSLLFGLLA
jgi:hypothetical protein